MVDECVHFLEYVGVGYKNWSWLISTRTLNNCFTHGVHKQTYKKIKVKFSVHMAGTIHVYTVEPTPTPMKQNMFLQFPFKQNIGLSPSNQKARFIERSFIHAEKKHRFSHLWDLDF